MESATEVRLTMPTLEFPTLNSFAILLGVGLVLIAVLHFSRGLKVSLTTKPEKKQWLHIMFLHIRDGEPLRTFTLCVIKALWAAAMKHQF
eukprot:3909478-Amphidinium_carterae.1